MMRFYLCVVTNYSHFYNLSVCICLVPSHLYVAVCGSNTNELRSRGNTHSQRSADIRRCVAALRSTAAALRTTALMWGVQLRSKDI